LAQVYTLIPFQTVFEEKFDLVKTSKAGGRFYGYPAIGYFNVIA
tara:strand:+ start:185 stop:316 length:132 start_codon:yes stop_codon:yes gene_type:complete